MNPLFLQLTLAGIASWSLLSSSAGAFVGAGPEALAAKRSTVIERTAGESKTYKIGALVIEAPWTRATPGGAQVAGGYLRIKNTGLDSDRLVGGTLPVAADVEVHEM